MKTNGNFKEKLNKLKEKAASLKKEITTLYYAYLDKDTPFLPKVIIILTIGYAASPIDLIPDFIPIIGYLDDLFLLPALITLSIKLIPKNIIDKCRKKAEQNQISLRKNWLAATIFIAIWIIILFFIVKTIYKILTKS
ncbi:MAG: YkvA family protein [Exilispira sp.]